MRSRRTSRSDWKLKRADCGGLVRLYNESKGVHRTYHLCNRDWVRKFLFC
jgi:hypothetical protein